MTLIWMTCSSHARVLPSGKWLMAKLFVAEAKMWFCIMIYCDASRHLGMIEALIGATLKQAGTAIL